MSSNDDFDKSPYSISLEKYGDTCRQAERSRIIVHIIDLQMEILEQYKMNIDEHADFNAPIYSIDGVKEYVDFILLRVKDIVNNTEGKYK